MPSSGAPRRPPPRPPLRHRPHTVPPSSPWRRRVLLLLSAAVGGRPACGNARPIFPDPRNFQAQSNGAQPMLASFDHTYPPLPILPDELSIARLPEKAMLRARGSSSRRSSSMAGGDLTDAAGSPPRGSLGLFMAAGPAVHGNDYDVHSNQFAQHLPVAQPAFAGGAGYDPPFTFAHAHAVTSGGGEGARAGSAAAATLPVLAGAFV